MTVVYKIIMCLLLIANPMLNDHVGAQSIDLPARIASYVILLDHI